MRRRPKLCTVHNTCEHTSVQSIGRRHGYVLICLAALPQKVVPEHRRVLASWVGDINV